MPIKLIENKFRLMENVEDSFKSIRERILKALQDTEFLEEYKEVILDNAFISYIDNDSNESVISIFDYLSNDEVLNFIQISIEELMDRPDFDILIKEAKSHTQELPTANEFLADIIIYLCEHFIDRDMTKNYLMDNSIEFMDRESKSKSFRRSRGYGYEDENDFM